MLLKRTLPLALTISIGLVTLVALLVPLPAVVDLITGWAGFLVAVALLLGVLNLFVVHLNRLARERNAYSGVLIISMMAVFALATIDLLNPQADSGVDTVFRLIQSPLEAALASLLAFFLLTAGFQLLKWQRSGWAILFALSAIVVLATGALVSSGLLPANVRTGLQTMRNLLDGIVVTAGMRGLLIGIALGTITLSLRLLFGVERPYQK